jgi:hypothetical protein
MLVLGIDAHKRTHTIVAVDELGRQKAQRTINATTADHLSLIAWAETLHDDRRWAVETAGISPGDSSGTCSGPANSWSGSRPR